MFIEGETFDDLLRKGLSFLISHGKQINPSKGPAIESIGISMKLENPLARFSRTETRATLFSALGETLWYLSGSDRFEQVEYYIPSYRIHCGTPPNVDVSEAAYGPRLRRQLAKISHQVKKPDTRKAVVAIFKESDHENLYDVPCTCVIQFFPRAGVLHAMGQMRSNDIYMGMAHDIFAFTFIQEYLARSNGLEVGEYIHQVGSLHLYESDRERADRYLGLGVADTIPMPAMPVRGAEAGLSWLLAAEAAIRLGSQCPDEPENLDVYWKDLARILKLKSAVVSNDKEQMVSIGGSMHSDCFKTFIDDEIAKK